jgi:nitrite reductase/ring-hydroxylating ferredoxin subunit
MPFVTVADVRDVPEGRGTLIEHRGRTIAIFNAGDGRVHATSPICPHEDGPLADGWVEAGAVVCPWHGFDFDLATGECRVDRRLAISVYAARVIGAVIEVDLP